MSTLETLQEIMVKEFSLNRAQLSPDAALESLGIDSLNVIDLMFKIEDRFKLQITDDIPTTLTTLDDVVRYIDTLLVGRSDVKGANVPVLSPVK